MTRLALAALAMGLLACSSTESPSAARPWNGGDLECDWGRVVANRLTRAEPTKLVVRRKCEVTIVDSTIATLDLTVYDDGLVDIQNSRLGGNLTGLGRARLRLVGAQPSGESALTAYADSDARVEVTRSHLRGEATRGARAPAGGNGNGSVTVTDSKLEARSGEYAIYTWGRARVTVRGGTLIGGAIAQDGGELDLQPAEWSTPHHTFGRDWRALQCLATAGVRVRAAVDDVRGKRAPSLTVDAVRGCADTVIADASHERGAMKPQTPPSPVDAPGRAWASQLVPYAGKAQQLHDYLAAGDDKDDGGRRGEALRRELDAMASGLESSWQTYGRLVVAQREAARALLSRTTTHRLERAMFDLMLAAQDASIAFGGGLLVAEESSSVDRDGVLAKLDVASEAATRLFDLLATEPTIADDVRTFWAPESGNATTWGALEAALRSLRDEVKRVRRALKDSGKPPTIQDALGIAARLDDVENHRSRMTFGG